jgi:hypothetical protein
MNDLRMYNYELSEHEIKEIAKAKILHYNFDDPIEEPTTNLFPRASTVLAFTSCYNGSAYGFGTGTNMQQVLDNTLRTSRSSITKVSRINGGTAQADYVLGSVASPINTIRVVSF